MFTVGEFSKICHVSIKTLHHYDKIGLLLPLKVDPLNGYRYYGRQQLNTMLLIGRLKRYGFSLEDIKLLLACKNDRVLFSKLNHQKEKLMMEKRNMDLIVGVCEKEKADKIMKSELCARTIHKGAYSSLSDAYGALVSWIEENGYTWNGAPYEIYLKTQFDNLAPKDWETEIFFPIKKK